MYKTTNRNLRSAFSKIVFLVAICVLVLITNCTDPSDSSETNWSEIETEFQNPPNSAKPRVWWHWMNGNISQDGIEKDLTWLNSIGIGGFQNFDAALSTPKIVEERLVYMTPAWKDAFEFTTILADSLNLEMAIAGSPGWSESGGPWVPPAEGMKKFVWTETRVAEGETFNGILPQPPSVAGPFQNLENEESGISLSETEFDAPEYYQDALVIAYKIPESETFLNDLQPEVSSSGGAFNLSMLTDGDLSATSLLPAAPAGEKSWIQFEFDEPQTIQAISIVGGGESGTFGFGASNVIRTLETSEDGQEFDKVVTLSNGGIPQTTVTFPPTQAKYFRVAFETPEPVSPGMDMSAISGFFGISDMETENSGTEIAEIVLHTIPRINRFEEKAGFEVITDVHDLATPEIDPSVAVAPEDIIDLTDQMQADGSLNWTPPEGTWNIIRFGYSLLGITNHPASPEATGLEVDKLNEEYVRNYFENYLDQYEDATGGRLGEDGLQYVITDSWEAGTANWTDDMVEEFNSRNEYDLIEWIPVLTGRIVKSSEESEQFLWDFRYTLGQMVAENHYDELTAILDAKNMGRYTESHENGRAFIGDGMEVKRSADIPMSATWTPGGLGAAPDGGVEVRHEADIRESASVAHIYGQNLVAAESFTAIGSSFAFDPKRIKPTADFMLASGLNRFVIHTSVHQPVDDKYPGLGLGPFGQWFTRHETWAQKAKPWIDYLARSSYLLQQGNFDADVLYVYGQGSNLTDLFGNELPPVPEGYNYDFLNAGAVPNVLSVINDQIVTETGMKYNLLVLDESTRYMTLPVLRKIKELVEAGASVAGSKPIKSPSLNDDNSEFTTIINELWANENGINQIGNGKVYAGYSMQEVLNDLQIEPDVMFNGISAGARMKFVHRDLGNQHIYWVSTNARQNSVPTVSFAVEGMEPEIWNPVTGEISETSYVMSEGRTEVTLNMSPEDALFVVFRNQTNNESFEAPEEVETELAVLDGEWQVNFQPERGAPNSAIFTELSPWNENEDEGIKYFSGTADYVKTIHVSEEWLSDDSEIWLDLGEVENLAEVFINGESQGIVWKEPFKLRIDESLQVGENQLSVEVTNLWVNRLIGDQQPGVENPIAYTTQPFYPADAPLLPSGLMGPVTISSVDIQ